MSSKSDRDLLIVAGLGAGALVLWWLSSLRLATGGQAGKAGKDRGGETPIVDVYGPARRPATDAEKKP